MSSVFSADPTADLHVIVVDDESPCDGLAEVLSLPRAERERVTVVRQANAGPAAARNRGLNMVDPSSDIIAFLDSDDRWTPAHLTRLHAAFRLGADLFFTNYRRPNSPCSAFQSMEFGPDWGELVSDELSLFRLLRPPFDLFLRQCPLAPSTTALRREVLGAIRFDPALRFACEDKLFFAQIARNAGTWMFSDVPDVVFGTGIGLFSTATWGTPGALRRIFDTLQYHQKLASDFDLTAEETTRNRVALRGLDEEFAENILYGLVKCRAVDLDRMTSYFRMRPTATFAVPRLLVRHALRRARIAACDG